MSSDGLTYTFTLKSGVNYGDPFGDVQVTSGDIVRALEREADPDASVGGYNFYYGIIDGFSAAVPSSAGRKAKRRSPRRTSVAATQPPRAPKCSSRSELVPSASVSSASS